MLMLQFVCYLQHLLVLGWGDNVLMTDLLSELDHGPSALPKGSQVTFLNTRSNHEINGEPECQFGLLDDLT